jgi:hypothetical protein
MTTTQNGYLYKMDIYIKIRVIKKETISYKTEESSNDN